MVHLDMEQATIIEDVISDTSTAMSIGIQAKRTTLSKCAVVDDSLT